MSSHSQSFHFTILYLFPILSFLFFCISTADWPDYVTAAHNANFSPCSLLHREYRLRHTDSSRHSWKNIIPRLHYQISSCLRDTVIPWSCIASVNNIQVENKKIFSCFTPVLSRYGECWFVTFKKVSIGLHLCFSVLVFNIEKQLMFNLAKVYFGEKEQRVLSICPCRSVEKDSPRLRTLCFDWLGAVQPWSWPAGEPGDGSTCTCLGCSGL